MAIKVNLSEFADALGTSSRHTIREMRDATVRGVQKSIPDLVAASPVDTGLYAQSWDLHVEEEAVILGNYAPYAGIIEYGTRKYKPPIGPLLAWAKRVLRNSKWTDKETGKTRTLRDTGQPESDYSSEVWALAIHTQQKIEAEGMKPRHVLRDQLPKIIANIKEEMKKLG